jgi:hypothetical protein
MRQQQASGDVFPRSLVAVAMAGLLASCGGSGSTPATPTATPVTLTDVFTGTLAATASMSFQFGITTQGAITATLTTFSPQTTITMGFGIGQPVNGVCTLISGAYTESAKMGYVLSGTITTGSYCVVLYDIGNMQGNNDFVITIVHS